jgi:hypothetical protein
MLANCSNVSFLFLINSSQATTTQYAISVNALLTLYGFLILSTHKENNQLLDAMYASIASLYSFNNGVLKILFKEGEE